VNAVPKPASIFLLGIAGLVELRRPSRASSRYGENDARAERPRTLHPCPSRYGRRPLQLRVRMEIDYNISLVKSAAICFSAASASGAMKRPPGPVT